MPALPPPRDDRDLRSALGREARLYGLGLVCATPGALAVWRTGSIWIGVLVFLAVLGVAGSALFAYERRRSARRRSEQPEATRRQIAQARARLAAVEQAVRDAARAETEQSPEHPQPRPQQQRSGPPRGRGRRGGRRR